MAGGIFGFLGLIAAHRGALEYDWRTKFGMPLSAVGRDMSITEAARQVRQLLTEPSSHTYAALHEWDYPLSQESMAVLLLADLFGQVNFKKWKPLERPWKTREVEHLGKTDLSQEEVIAALRAAGHTAALPSAA